MNDQTKNKTRTLFGTFEDHNYDDLSLDHLLIADKNATFFFRAKGQAMFPYICDGDLLIIDRSLSLSSKQDKRIAVIEWEGEFLCRQLIKTKKSWLLKSFNGDNLLSINQDQEMILFGMVKAIVRQCIP